MNESGLASIRRALLSVSDKTGIVELARFLTAHGVDVLSTGGTARLLREHGIAATEVSDYTGFPEIMDGRLKTLHPKIHGGLLGRREQDRAVMSEHGIGPIDLLAVNLYPFEQTAGKAGVAFDKAVEKIDVGGPAMIRAASKNHRHVAVMVEPADYAAVMREMRDRGGISRALRSQLAVKAFARTAAYDTAISGWLARAAAGSESEPAPRPESGEEWPATLNLSLRRVSPLRYGENPHQKAAFYADADAGSAGGLAGAEQMQGKALSYNNIADASVACECAYGFDAPACVIVKHANPCGAACADSPGEAYRRAVAADPVSAFGGIVAFNRVLDAGTARGIVGERFAEVIVAPGVAQDALDVLAAKPALRVLVCPAPAPGRPGHPGHPGGRVCHSVFGGVLVQERDRGAACAADLAVKTQRRPGAGELDDLLFAWRVVKFVKSNAIVLAHGAATAGIGAGQASRIGAVRIAGAKSREQDFAGKPPVMASDAFFPFRDGIDAAAAAGVTAVIQPGGSIRDGEVIAAADEHGVAMVFTGVRHFRH